MKVAFGLLIGSVLLAGTGMSGEPPVSVTVSPRVSMAPATVELSVTVPPDERNRMLTVATDSGEFYRSSEMPLEGENASRLQKFTFKNLPPGDYIVAVRLSRSDGGDRIAETELVVTGF